MRPVANFLSARRAGALFCASLACASAPALADKISNPVAIFDGLDKITGRIISFEVGINETVQFGTLQVTPRVCYSRPPTDAPQTDAFAQVDELDEQKKTKRIFSGWMFADSPGLHGVEHPIYDIWLINCKGGTTVIHEAPQTAAVDSDENVFPDATNDPNQVGPDQQNAQAQVAPQAPKKRKPKPAVVAAPLPDAGDNAPLDLGGGGPSNGGRGR